MGIRNLAMCNVVIPNESQSKQEPVVPIVQAWERIPIANKAGPRTSVDGEIHKPATKEAFEPQTYAQHAYDLVFNRILPSKPSLILIERQRFRSMGGSAVQEWTLRVNMFEAMIYATLKTSSEQGLWNGTVHPVSPAAVSKFWLGSDDSGAGKATGSKSSKTKSAKIALVADWLSKGQRFAFQGEAADIARAYQSKLARRPRKVNAKQSDQEDRDIMNIEIGKLDDLADCLLQAAAWIQWEENRRALVL